VLHGRAGTTLSYSDNDQIQCGRIECDRTTEDFPGANWPLFVTFVNDLEQESETYLLSRHPRGSGNKKTPVFPEVFDPNVNSGIRGKKLANSSMIISPHPGRMPDRQALILKIVYHGPRAMEELRNMIQSGRRISAQRGTTYDASS